MSKNINFDLDDPLGDLLSDNSDDSFFKDEKHKTPEKKITQTLNLDKKKSDLFGLENESVVNEPEFTHITQPISSSKTRNQSSGDWLGLDDETPESKTQVNVIQTVNIPEKKLETQGKLDPVKAVKHTKSSFPDDLNFLDDLGLSDDSSTNLPKTAAKKNTTFDDVLGKPVTSTVKRSEIPPVHNTDNSYSGYSPSVNTGLPIKEDTTKVKKSVSKTDIDKILLESKPKARKVESTNDIIRQVPLKESAPIPSRRQRSNSDWLGIYPENEDEGASKKNQIIKVAASDDVLPDWLEPQKKDITAKEVNNTKKKSEQIESTVAMQQETVKKPELKQDLLNLPLNNIDFSNSNQVFSEIGRAAGQPLLEETLGSAPGLQLLVPGGLAQQSAAVCLQHNESQLMVALQLQAQEERISALHERQEESRRVQREVVSAHRQQLETVLKGQADHRDQLQKVMVQHQDRINKHIQSLLRPPSPISNKVTYKHCDVGDDHKEDEDVKECYTPFQSEKKTNVSERIQLEQIIFNLKENHTKEIEIMETSYKRQIHLVDESLIQIEERLKTENEKLSQHYLTRIQMLEEERAQLVVQAEDRVKAILEKQKRDEEMIERKHVENINILQEQHRIVIQNIKETISLEQSSIRESTDYSRNLKTILEGVKQNNEMCTDFMKKIEVKANEQFTEKDNFLKIKEHQIHYLLDSLQKQREAFELESADMKRALQLFEESLKHQTQAIEEEKVKLKQKENELEVERENIKRQNERDIINLNHEKMKMNDEIKKQEEIKLNFESDIAEKLLKINEENLIIKNERKVIEELKNKSQALKLSLESELEEMNECRKNIKNDEQRLHQEEIKVSARSQELELLTRSALAKHVMAEQKISETLYAQQKYEDRIKRMQEHAISLNAREQQIARDKVALSRERLMLHNQQKESERKCGLCKTHFVSEDMFRYNIKDLTKYNSIDTEMIENNHVQNNVSEMAVSRDNLLIKNISRRKSIDQKFDFLSKMTDNKYKMNENEFSNSLNEWKLNNLNCSDEYEQNDFHGVAPGSERPTSLFQEIIDPKLVLLKLDIQHSTKPSTS